MKKIGQVFVDLLLCIFLAIVALIIGFVVVSNRDVDGTAEIMGYQLRIVTSDSMGECDLTDVSGYEIKSIPVKSLIVVKTMPKEEVEANEWYKNVKVGDVLTFRYVYGNQITITHRVASITEKEDGGFIIDLAGDNVNAKDNQLYQTIDTSIPDNPNYVIGKVVWNAKWAGQLLSTLRTPIGLIFLIWIPCVLITIMQVYDIGTGVAERQEIRTIKKIRYAKLHPQKSNNDAELVRYIDRQYEKAQGRSWRKYTKQYKHRKAVGEFPQYTGNGKAYRTWKRYAKQYQTQDPSESTIRFNENLGKGIRDNSWQRYSKGYQSSQSVTPMPRFKDRHDNAKK